MGQKPEIPPNGPPLEKIIKFLRKDMDDPKTKNSYHCLSPKEQKELQEWYDTHSPEEKKEFQEWHDRMSPEDMQMFMDANNQDYHQRPLPNPHFVVSRQKTPEEERQAQEELEILEGEIKKRLNQPGFKKLGMDVYKMLVVDYPDKPDLHQAIVGRTGWTLQKAELFTLRVNHELYLAVRDARRIIKEKRKRSDY